ncbi:MAG: efflux RND transporter periplasmic adaptor subunit [Bacteroidetes bacterium]|nr:efflux RND transporter periplasmic adaptor subunit [Bacteroidota bacterium]
MATAACLAVLAAALLAGCGPKEPPNADANAFVLSDTMLKRIRLDTVKVRKVEGVIDLNGRISADENRMASVFAIMSGQVVSVNAELGDHVNKGQELAEIRSSEVADLERELIDARGEKDVAQKNLATKEDLFKSQLLSEPELVEARYQLEKANAQLKRMNEIFSIYTFDSASRYVLRAPMSGYIIAKSIARDVTLPADQQAPVFTIAELDEVWVLADVYESDIPRVKEGMDAEVTTLSYPGKVLHGKVDRIFNMLDPDTRTMRIRITLSNPGVLLKPEMVARVRLSFQENDSLPSIPAGAVITDGGKQYVMVFKDRYNITTREITPERTTGNTTWITDGLKPGEVIIGREQLYIYDALNDQ